jgi:hypothetical protein
MRIPSGVTDQYIYFVAVDPTDLKTRETGLTSFTVYRSRDGGAATAYTTPTVTELSAANMPGVYALLLDEDMTIGAGNDSEEICLHITQASMAPVTRVFELYRPKITAGNTLNVEADGDVGGNVTGSVGSVTGTVAANVTQFGGSAGTFAGGRPEVNASHVAGTAQSTGDINAKIGTPSNLGGGATLAANLSDIEGQTDDIGVAGAGLTALGDIRLANLDVTVSSRSTYAGGAVASVTGAVGSVTGDVGGKVLGGGAGTITGVGAQASLGTDAVTAAAVSAAAGNKIADHTLRRSYANARASSDGDTVSFRSPLGAIAKLVNRWAIATGVLHVYHEDDTTEIGTGQTVTSSASAEPITELNTN